MDPVALIFVVECCGSILACHSMAMRLVAVCGACPIVGPAAVSACVLAAADGEESPTL
jgi:hypothetical protein